MSDNSYKEWLETSIREGSIYCCPDSDIKRDPNHIGQGSFGVVYKATVKQKNRVIPTILGRKHNILSGMTVAVKTLSPNNNDGLKEEDLYRDFVKEVTVNYMTTCYSCCIHITMETGSDSNTAAVC